MNIALIIGSLRRESFNRQLAYGLARIAPSTVMFNHASIDSLPLYNQDDDDQQAASVRTLKGEIEASDGVLFVTPEYNRSIPGVLKNAIDHASRPHGQNSWATKPAGIIGVSIGSAGTCMAQQHLRNVLAYLDMPTMGQPEAYLQMRDGMFDGAGNIGPASLAFLQSWIEGFVAWVSNGRPERH